MPHPHMRGEYDEMSKMSAPPIGSSPHAWGIQRAAHAAGRLRRFIPTCVGNTRPSAPAWWITSVHPHMRGEYFHCRQSSKASAGSSPHAWGILPGCIDLQLPYRFIPTCVGNTPGGHGRRQTSPVHPHMRGEYISAAQAVSTNGGSSPHAWGIPEPPYGPPYNPRFIPTCVGNTSTQLLQQVEHTVHPHMRGEYSCRIAGSSGHSGSSPHAWGIRPRFFLQHEAGRFIPTCVGNTAASRMAPRSRPVHPHMRGEYMVKSYTASGYTGSSPHAWGIRSDVLGSEAGGRFIPTCVGNTRKSA